MRAPKDSPLFVIVIIIPLFGLWLLGGLPRDAQALQYYFTTLLYLAAMLLSWHLTIWSIEQTLRIQQDAQRAKRVATLSLCAISVIIALGSLALIRNVVPYSIFITALLALTLRGIASGLIRSGRGFEALGVLISFDCLVSYIIASRYGLVFNVPALILSLGLGLSIGASRLARLPLFGLTLIDHRRHESALTYAGWWQKTVLALSISGLTSCLILIFSGHLTKHYYLVFLLIPLLNRLSVFSRQTPTPHMEIYKLSLVCTMLLSIVFGLATILTTFFV